MHRVAFALQFLAKARFLFQTYLRHAVVLLLVITSGESAVGCCEVLELVLVQQVVRKRRRPLGVHPVRQLFSSGTRDVRGRIINSTPERHSNPPRQPKIPSVVLITIGKIV